MNSCGQDASSIKDQVDFNFDVKPILVQKCYLCHGPDSVTRKGGLRFDTFEGATAILKNGGQAIVPGHLDSSIMVARIHHTEPDMIMPPSDSKLKLTDKEINILTQWIKQGAEWMPHWAFIPPKSPNLKGLSKNQSEIDFFIGKEITKGGLKKAPQANKNSLIRRVSYLITGLPPSMEAIQNYLSDQSPNAYEKMVDQYLQSPRFGEKWARHWMDVVRYAETKGHEFDYQIPGAWRYRDYLIKAFNLDVPYDQMVKEHLAGDLIPDPRRDVLTGVNESHLGTNFLTMSEGTHSPVDVRKDESDRIDNMIDVTTKAFQGLTVSCARCHDHKFDPITTKEYYGLYGIMESSRFSPVPAIRTIQQEQDLGKVNELKLYLRDLIAEQWKTDATSINSNVPKSVHGNKSSKMSSSRDSGYSVIADFRGNNLNDWQIHGQAFGKHTTLGNPLFNDQYELLELDSGKASSRSLGFGLFGALRSPNFIIEKKYIGIRARGIKSSLRIIIDNFQLISYPIFENINQKVDKEEWQNYIIDVDLWKGHKAYVEILPGYYENHVYKLPKEAYVEIEYANSFDKKRHDLPMPYDDKLSTAVQAIEDWSSWNATPGQIELLNRLLKNKSLANRFLKAEESISKNNLLKSNFTDTSFFNGIYDGFAINSPVFKRGNHHELTSEVPRKFLSALSVPDSISKSTGSGRKELAESFLHPDNPLTSRVMVNRIWHHIFGRGIVETTDNFGLQGKLPAFPALLDFLALKYQHEGWSTKKMIRYILRSETFKRSVYGDAESDQVDPENIYLAHFPLRRMEAEDIRDGILAVSGRLDTAMFGKPVPLHITTFMQGRGRPKNSGPIDGRGRRSIYQEVRRNFLEPLMITFDRPIPFSTFGKRNETNVPAQSLILMNDPFILQQAEEMACMITAGEWTVDERIEFIYLQAFARKPIPEEAALAKSYLVSLCKTHGVKENELLKSVVVWKDYCHSIFNTKEFIYLM